jgi:hypothetical protein
MAIPVHGILVVAILVHHIVVHVLFLVPLSLLIARL